MLKLRYWALGLNGPVKIEREVPPDPAVWGNNPTALVEVVGKIDYLEWLIEDAREYGWGFNPYTRSFYRLD